VVSVGSGAAAENGCNATPSSQGAALNASAFNRSDIHYFEEVTIMKSLIAAAFAAAVVTIFAAPTLSFAQSTDGPVTRAEVRANLVQLERAGYHPEGADLNYPADIQMAEARVSQQANANPGIASDVGVTMSGSGASATPSSHIRTRSIYFGH
jgi:hypothetical protein